MPELLASLIDKSLLVPSADGARLRMLETIREYGSERLAERGELAATRRRHADHFAQVVAAAEPHLTRDDQLPWLAVISAEQDNIVAALRYRCDVGDADGALGIAVSLGSYAMLLGNHPDIPSWVGEALAVPGSTDREAQAVARALLSLSAASLAIDSSTHNQTQEQLRGIADEVRDLDFARWGPIDPPIASGRGVLRRPARARPGVPARRGGQRRAVGPRGGTDVPRLVRRERGRCRRHARARARTRWRSSAHWASAGA